jgi:hypothetical protein
MIRSLSERGGSFTCARTINRLLATCGNVQTVTNHRRLTGSLDALALTLIRSCVDASVYMPSPHAAGARVVGGLASLDAAKVGSRSGGGGGGVNEDDVAIIEMERRPSLMATLLSSSSSARRNLCALLARAVPSLRRDVVQVALAFFLLASLLHVP